jgi:energy-coupling factor transporter ATP-binding protein EcfA2
MIQLEEFDVQKIIKDDPDPTKRIYPTILIVGPRGCGKTTLVKDLMGRLGTVAKQMVTFSKTELINEVYTNIMPNMLINDKPDPIIFARINERQGEYIRKINKKNPGFSQNEERFVVVLDDCIETTKDSWTKDQALGGFFTLGRHSKLIIVVVVHSIKSVPPMLRTNADFVFIYKTGNLLEKKKIKEEFISAFDKKEFDPIFEKYTDNYKCIVVNNTAKENDMTARYTYYKANFKVEPKVCDPLLWKVDKLLFKLIYQKKMKVLKNKEKELKKTKSHLLEISK